MLRLEYKRELNFVRCGNPDRVEVSVCLDRRLLEKLDMIAEVLGISMDDIINAKLWEYVRWFEKNYGSV